MATNESFALEAELARQAEFIAANTTQCRKCGTKTPCDKRQMCGPCARKRLHSMKDCAASVPVPERVGKSESAAEANARLRRAWAQRANAGKTAPTVASLLAGPYPQAKGAALNHASTAMSARSNLAAIIKKLAVSEAGVIAFPLSVPAWDAYSRLYDSIDALIKTVKHHELELRRSHPDLVTVPLLIPVKLQRTADREWLTI